MLKKVCQTCAHLDQKKKTSQCLAARSSMPRSKVLPKVIGLGNAQNNARNICGENQL
jgi:hypothetical protein